MQWRYAQRRYLPVSGPTLLITLPDIGNRSLGVADTVFIAPLVLSLLVRNHHRRKRKEKKPTRCVIRLHLYKIDMEKDPAATQQMDKASSPNGPVSALNKSDVEDGFDAEYERRLVRKLDKHIVPVIMSLYLFSFLDRYAVLKIVIQLKLSSANIVSIHLESTSGMRCFTV